MFSNRRPPETIEHETPRQRLFRVLFLIAAGAVWGAVLVGCLANPF